MALSFLFAAARPRRVTRNSPRRWDGGDNLFTPDRAAQ